MSSIGEIITTPQGLAVVVQVLPTQLNVGGQTVSQVVVAPLTGGPAPVGAPASAPSLPGFSPTVQAQAGAVYVALVAATPDTSSSGAVAGTGGAPSSSGASSGGTGSAPDEGSPDTAPTSVDFSSAATAYQTTSDLTSKTSSQTLAFG